MRHLVAVVSLLFTVSVLAEELPCGSSEETNQIVREAALWSASRARDVAAKGLETSAVVNRDHVYLLNADATNTPFRNPFDLSGRTLIFERDGSSRFAMRNVPLEWTSELGTFLPLQGSADEMSASVTLDFDFPFFEGTARTLHVSGNNAIYFSAPAASQIRQYGDADLATFPAPVIAPMLTTRSSRLGATSTVYVLKNGDSVSITWLMTDRYNVRATLNRNGEIRFSYRDVTVPPAASALVITSGSEPWRTSRTTIASTTDPTGDLRTTINAPSGPMLDITGVSVTRVSGLDLYELRVSTAAPVDARAAGETLQFIVVMNQLTFRYTAYADGRTRTSLPVWGSDFGSSSARVEGNDVVFTFLDDHVADNVAATVVARAYRVTTLADSSVGFNVSIPAATTTARTDFSATTASVFDHTPILEAFSLPVLSVARVWSQIKAAYPYLNDDSIDGVAIYQNFYTDLVTYAGAYSTGGNAAVSGLTQGDNDALFLPRTPALMHMNTIGYGHNRTSPGASRVVLHELGHRWLLFVSLLENGSRTQVLNPVSAHPAQYVDTRAAFKVYTDSDTSVMGGGWFTENANGTFTSGPYGPYSYSWLDLYLMGLASPEEVRPMFYIANSSPPLGSEYYAPANQTYSGQRREFTLQQIVDATGKRDPAYPSTQREFRVVFVLMSDPSRELPQADIDAVQTYRGLLERDFAIATNGRGSVKTSIDAPPPPGPRRRAVRR